MDGKIILCAIAKNEYEYILDWVKYHIRIGFDKVIIYDNNDTNGERYDSLLKDYIEDGLVELRNRRGLTGQQALVYNECYNSDDFDWMAVIDLDEYIWFAENGKYNDIKSFIKSFDDSVDVISLYWKCYGDNNKIDNNPSIPVYERFTTPMETDIRHKNHVNILNKWPKSIYKKGVNIRINEHFVEYTEDECKSVDCLNNNFIYNPTSDYIEKTYSVCYIKHYISKSISEWYSCKINRGIANTDGGGGTQEFYEKNNVYAWHHGFDTFFNYNEFTPEKVKYLKSVGYDVKVIFRPTVLLSIFINSQEDINRFMPYYSNLQEVCNLKTIFYVDDKEDNQFIDIPGVPYTEKVTIYKGYDLNMLYLLSFNNYQFKKDEINIYINIGSSIYEGIRWNSIDKLFGNVNTIRNMFENCIKFNNTYINSDDIIQTNSLLHIDSNFDSEINYLCQKLGYNDISPYIIDGNCFITPFNTIWEEVIQKDIPYKLMNNVDIVDMTLKYKYLTSYQAYLCVYPNMFRNIVKI